MTVEDVLPVKEMIIFDDNKHNNDHNDEYDNATIKEKKKRYNNDNDDYDKADDEDEDEDDDNINKTYHKPNVSHTLR